VGNAMDVDAHLWPPPHANPRLRGDARGRDGYVCEKLAARVGHGKDDDEAEPTGSSNFVLRRDRDRPRRGWHPRDAMQSMAIRGFVAHNRKSGAYALTDSGRAALTAILEGAP